MTVDWEQTRKLVLRDTLHPRRVKWLERISFVALSVGLAVVVMDRGIRESTFFHRPWEFGALAVLSMCVLAATLVACHYWSLARPSFLRERRSAVGITLAWLVGIVAVVIFGPILPGGASGATTRWDGFVVLSELALIGRSLAAVLHGLRGATAAAFNPALILVTSFIGLIAIGTVLLMLPRARVTPELGPAERTPFVTALFTATSATCVTGLIVEDTPTYWSREGQVVILTLFQIGGLGIMTFGAFFGLLAGRNIQLKEHATLNNLLESEGLGDVRRLLLAILGFTLLAEGLGVIGLFGLWSDSPLGERMFLSLFHSVSAFCNAGFALTPNSFVGMAHRWQVGGVLSLLIIIGGLGFSVLFDFSQAALTRIRQLRFIPKTLLPHRPRRRVALTTRVVFTTTSILLIAGMLGLFLLERATMSESRASLPLADAWFQSVTFRTAGFNTVALGELHPATKLLAILMMFIGASPGSTGGGVKTVVFAIAVLGIVSTLRGRNHIEVFSRSLPQTVVQRALVILFLSLMTVMTTTILLMLYEDRPQFFIDYLFEAVSAVGTVGVSSSIPSAAGEITSVTASLSTPSRFVIIAAMFLGRIGPLTLLIALAGKTSTARYHYPEERMTLG